VSAARHTNIVNFVIGETTSHSTKPASGQVAGYPGLTWNPAKSNIGSLCAPLDTGLRRYDEAL
jgi:hypothetical protein